MSVVVVGSIITHFNGTFCTTNDRNTLWIIIWFFPAISSTTTTVSAHVDNAIPIKRRNDIINILTAKCISPILTVDISLFTSIPLSRSCSSCCRCIRYCCSIIQSSIIQSSIIIQSIIITTTTQQSQTTQRSHNQPQRQIPTRS